VIVQTFHLFRNSRKLKLVLECSASKQICPENFLNLAKTFKIFTP